MVKYCAVDVEMVETVSLKNSLARVTIVDESKNVLLDEFVLKPKGLFYFFI